MDLAIEPCICPVELSLFTGSYCMHVRLKRPWALLSWDWRMKLCFLFAGVEAYHDWHAIAFAGTI